MQPSTFLSSNCQIYCMRNRSFSALNILQFSLEEVQKYRQRGGCCQRNQGSCLRSLHKILLRRKWPSTPNDKKPPSHHVNWDRPPGRPCHRQLFKFIQTVQSSVEFGALQNCSRYLQSPTTNSSLPGDKYSKIILYFEHFLADPEKERRRKGVKSCIISVQRK